MVFTIVLTSISIPKYVQVLNALNPQRIFKEQQTRFQLKMLPKHPLYCNLRSESLQSLLQHKLII